MSRLLGKKRTSIVYLNIFTSLFYLSQSYFTIITNSTLGKNMPLNADLVIIETANNIYKDAYKIESIIFPNDLIIDLNIDLE